MRLEDLRVFHLSKKDATTLPEGLADSLRGAFFLDSCQRWLWVQLAGPVSPSSKRAATNDATGIVAADAPLQVFSGEAAYRFLLAVACGLESEVLGETDIFGQLKDAWRDGGGADASVSTEISPWLQRLFEDTKEIRSRYLQNVGGTTYGSLVRMLLKEAGSDSDSDSNLNSNSKENGPILLVGAGKIGSAVAPYLCQDSRELLIANRSRKKAEALREELLAAHPGVSIQVVDELDGWRRAQDVVVCIPFDPSGDSARIAAWKRSGGGALLHLAGATAAAGEWASVEGFRSLDDLFALQKLRGDVRSTQIQRARAACFERAKLRSLGGSISLPHGWEDLALFA